MAACAPDHRVDLLLACAAERLGEAETGDPLLDRHALLCRLAQDTIALVATCEREIAGRDELLDLLEAESLVGGRHFDAADGSTDAMRKANAKKAFYDDANRLAVWQTKQDWYERLGQIRALEFRLKHELARVELQLRARE